MCANREGEKWKQFLCDFRQMSIPSGLGRLPEGGRFEYFHSLSGFPSSHDLTSLSLSFYLFRSVPEKCAIYFLIAPCCYELLSVRPPLAWLDRENFPTPVPAYGRMGERGLTLLWLAC